MKKGFILSLVGMLSIISCSNTQQEVNLYSARHYDTDVELYETFTNETGIKVNLIEGSSDELIERIKSEGLNSPADVFITVDAGRMWRAQESDILQPLASEVVNQRISESLRQPDGQWISLTKRIRGIVYNTDKVNPEDLSSYEDLAEPKWKGKVCVRSSNNIYNQSLLASIVESLGEEAAEEWARGIVENFARDPQGGDTDQVRAVAAGVCDVAIANHYYYVRLLGSDATEDQDVVSKTAFYFPNQADRGAHANVSAAGLVANAPNKDNAVKFIEYLTSSRAQELLAEGNKEYPANAAVSIAEVLEGLGEFKTDEVNVASYGVNNPIAVRIFDRVGWK